jgi:hypothetical protein
MKSRLAAFATAILSAGVLTIPSAGQARSSWSIHYSSGPYWYDPPRVYSYAPPPCRYYVRAYPRYYRPVYPRPYYAPVYGGFSFSYHHH